MNVNDKAQDTPQRTSDVRSPSEEATLHPPHQDSETRISPVGDSYISGVRLTKAAGNPSESDTIFGNYRIIREIARGGMGVVFEAVQLSLNRRVALKMILSGQLASREDVARFYVEAESAANLDHTGIVPIYEIGHHQDQHFYSMSFIEGQSLQQIIQQGPLELRQAAAFTAKIAAAIAYAHEKGVIHRDLKPANVLVDVHGEPKITDFGLARKLASKDGLTQTGAVMGTPGYMPPEQAQGKTSDVGPLSDVYSLGAILYCLLTGRPPFQAATPLDTLLQVIEQQPAPPRLLNQKIDRDLETICLKCLEKLPSRRYASAQQLSDDLNRYLQGETISARSVNLINRIAVALERGQYDKQFSSWGSMLIGFSVVIGLAHVATTAALLLLPSPTDSVPVIFGIHILMFAGLLVLFLRNRSEGLMPRTAAERQLWGVIGGFVAACILTGSVDHLMSSPARPHEPLRLYPVFSVLSGLTLLLLGSNYWGTCYLLGMGFWFLALALPFSLELGPAGFGLMWTTTLLTIGYRLKSLASHTKN